MRLTSTIFLFIVLTLVFPVSTSAADLASRWAGSYSCKETNFVTLKRLTFTKEKDGSIKVRGALVGFPDEVSIGEAIAEPYSNRNDKKENADILVATFSSDKFKPLIIIQQADFDSEHIRAFTFTCYMKDVDGSRVHINGVLRRDE